MDHSGGHSSGGEVHGGYHGGYGGGGHADGDAHHGAAHAHGSLIGALNGHGYAHESYAHALAHGGHHHREAGHVHHGGMSTSQTMALILALEVAQQHDHSVTALGGYQVGHIAQAPHLGGTHADTTSIDTRKVNLPGIARDDSTVEVLYWPHGACNPKGEVERLCRKWGMTPINPAKDNLLIISERQEARLLANTPFASMSDPDNMPNGWYKKALGSTHLWQQYWQVQPPQYPWGLNWLIGRPNYQTWQTFLVVYGATWHYSEIGDYETRIAFSVYSLPFTKMGDWTYRWDDIRVHRNKAECLAAASLKYLKSFPPSAGAIGKREALDPELLKIEVDETPRAYREPVDIKTRFGNLPIVRGGYRDN